MKRIKNYASFEAEQEEIFSHMKDGKENSENYHCSDVPKVIDFLRKVALRLRKDTFKAVIIGDYDVDGITSTSCLVRILAVLAGMPVDEVVKRVTVYLPRRFSDGYGASEKLVEKLCPMLLEDEEGALITIDNGIAANEAVILAKALGWEVCIIDHHEKKEDAELPMADVILDPHVTGTSDFVDYCAAGLAFKIAQAIPEMQMPVNENLYQQIQVFAGIGTIGDSMHLIEEQGDSYGFDNWLIARRMLELITQNAARTNGLYCLLRLLNLDYAVSSTDVAFTLCPCLNAPGRMRDDGAQFVFEFINRNDAKFNELDALAEKVKGYNDERKAITDELKWKYITKIRETGAAKSPLIFVRGNKGEIPQGVAGILAGDICNRFYSMAIVTSPNETETVLHGSGRAPEGQNIKALLDECKECFVSYGGHKGAAGLTLKVEAYESFMQKAVTFLGEKLEAPEGTYDYDADAKEVEKLVQTIDMYEPYGRGHELPTFRFEVDAEERGYNKTFFSLMGKNKTSLKIYGQSNTNFLMFDRDGLSKFYELGSPKSFVCYGTVGKNTYQGKTTMQVIMSTIEAKPTAENEERDENAPKDC